MNKEVIKAIERNNKPTKMEVLRYWWGSYHHIFFRIVLFPIWIIILIYDKINKYLDSRVQWDTKRADEILSYYIPRRADWNEEKKSFYFFDNGNGWAMWSAKKYLKLKDRRFWKNNTCGFDGGQIRRYLTTTFELDGFTKETVHYDMYSGITEIVFKMIEDKGAKDDNS